MVVTAYAPPTSAARQVQARRASGTMTSTAIAAARIRRRGAVWLTRSGSVPEIVADSPARSPTGKFDASTTAGARNVRSINPPAARRRRGARARRLQRRRQPGGGARTGSHSLERRRDAGGAEQGRHRVHVVRGAARPATRLVPS